MGSGTRVSRSAWRGLLGVLCVAAFVAAMVFAPITAQAQSATGRILGNVHDQSGAAIVGATVTIIDVQRGVSRTLATDQAGDYLAPNLVAGMYGVKAEAKGFEAIDRRNIQLEVATDARIDFQLLPGEATQTVVVTAESPMLDSTSSTLGGTLSNQIINDLPLNGRNYENLLQLRPEVVSYPGGGLSTHSSNGVRPEDNMFLWTDWRTSSRLRGRASSMVGRSPATPRRFCRLTLFRNSTCRPIPRRNMDGSPERWSTSD